MVLYRSTIWSFGTHNSDLEDVEWRFGPCIENTAWNSLALDAPGSCSLHTNCAQWPVIMASPLLHSWLMLHYSGCCWAIRFQKHRQMSINSFQTVSNFGEQDLKILHSSDPSAVHKTRKTSSILDTAITQTAWDKICSHSYHARHPWD